MIERHFDPYLGQPVMEGDGGRPVYDCQPDTADGCLIPVPHTYVTEIATEREPRELQVMHSPMPEPELDEPEA